MAFVVFLGLEAEKEVGTTVVVTGVEKEVSKSIAILLLIRIGKFKVKMVERPYVSSKNAFSSCTKGAI